MIEKGSIIYDTHAHKTGVVKRLYTTKSGKDVKYYSLDLLMQIITVDMKFCTEVRIDSLTSKQQAHLVDLMDKGAITYYKRDEPMIEEPDGLTDPETPTPDNLYQLENKRLGVRAEKGIEVTGELVAEGDVATIMETESGNAIGLSNVADIANLKGTISVDQAKEFWEREADKSRKQLSLMSKKPAPEEVLHNEKADRHNTGKRRYHLIDYKVLGTMVEALEFGAKKYSPNNWKKGLPTEEIFDSIMRHLTALQTGEELDPESKAHHTGHILCNAMFMAYMYQSKREFISWESQPQVN